MTAPEFVFAQADLEAIRRARSEDKPWECTDLADLRSRLKKHNEVLQHNLCCYCRCEQTDEFEMVIDNEHVLPKSIFPEFMFELLNLSASCKRCNMRIKRERTDFVHDLIGVRNDHGNSAHYKIIHPNLDKYEEHLTRLTHAVGVKRIVKYVIVEGSEKGRATFDYFELKQKEVDTYDAAQQPDSSHEERSVSSFRQLIADLESSM